MELDAASAVTVEEADAPIQRRKEKVLIGGDIMPRKRKIEVPQVEEPIVEVESAEEPEKAAESIVSTEVEKDDEQITTSIKDKLFGVKPPVKKDKVKKPSDIVKVKVIIGTLKYEKGTFQKGDIFTETRERAERFERTSALILT